MIDKNLFAFNYYNKSNTLPIISIWVLTYNHAKYIKECLIGIFSQKTNLNYEVLIGDDCSSDKTYEIINEISSTQKHPITIIRSKKNLWDVSGTVLAYKLFSIARGKYVALCEGDDFWTDQNKLEKQVDYLDSNPHCSFCFTDFQAERNKTLQELHPNFKKENQFIGINFADQVASIAQTCTWLVRRECIQNLPDWVTSAYTADWCMQVHFSKFGKGGYIPETTAVYRIHENGVWSKLSPFDGWRKNLKFYKTAMEQFKEKSSKNLLKNRIRSTIIDALELANIQANKSEIRKWLWIKLTSNPFNSVQQSIHSLKLLLVF
jgi:glycosyltransferase involved in cell wall biosynthesis